MKILTVSGLVGMVLVGCGGEGGGGSDPPKIIEAGTPIVCRGAWNQADGEKFVFPCVSGPTGCVPIDDNAAATEIGCLPSGPEKLLPGFDADRDFKEGFCACAEDGADLPSQQGSCNDVCSEIATKNLVVRGETGWTCGTATPIDNPVAGPAGSCRHGSIIYLNRGPADYGARLFGTQTTGGSKYGFSRHGSGNVDAMIEYSLGDRTQGCATGCPIQITNLQVLVHPFAVPGVDAFIFSWPGLQMQTSTLVVQGMMNGLVYDDGHFVIQPGDETLLVNYQGSVSDKFGTSLTQNLTGHVDFASGSIVVDEIVRPSGDGAMVIHQLSGAAYKSPPTAVIATPPTLECQKPEGVDVTLDASGTTDAQGQQVTARWHVDGMQLSGSTTTLSLGTHTLHLTARDVTMGRGFAAKQVLVQDTTPPVWSAPPKADFTSCDAQVDTQVLVPPVVGDSCTGVDDVQLYLVESNGSAVAPPRLLDATAAVLPKGKGVVRWVATDGAGNQASVVQDFEVGVALFATGHFEVRDRAKILQANGAPAALGAVGVQTSQFGVWSLVGEVQSLGSLFLQNYAAITGLGRAQGTIEKQEGAKIGLEQSHATVNLIGLPWLANAPTSFVGSNFEVQRGNTATLPSAMSGVVSVKSGGRLLIPFASTRIRELWIEPDAIVEFTSPSAELWIGDRWVHRGTVVGSGTLRVNVVGTQVLLERPVRGVYLIAPNARVTITTMATGSKFGLLVGDTVEVQPDVTLWCDRDATL